MLEALLFFTPLLAGYVFAVTWNYSRYTAAREDSQRIYFRAALYGIFIFVISFFLALIIKLYVPDFAVLVGQILKFTFPQSLFHFGKSDDVISDVDAGLFIIFLVLMVLFGCLMGVALNGAWKAFLFCVLRLAKKDWRHWFYRKIIDQAGDDVELLLIRALEKTMPVLTTMENRKVYVGWVIESYELRSDRKTLRLLPVLSGYRSDGDLTVKFTTSYTTIYQDIILSVDKGNGLDHLCVDDFEIVLQCSCIQSISLFDMSAYRQFSQHDGNEAEVGPAVAIGPESAKEDGQIGRLRNIISKVKSFFNGDT